MGKETGIAWCDHTFNPWWGCVEVSPACDNCYARTFAHRMGREIWGRDSDRRIFGDKHWNEPRKWNAAAAKRGVHEFVFCASMADVFEKHDHVDLDVQRSRLWKLIAETPSLVWLLLTKRPQNIARMAPDHIRAARNVWFGTTVESPDFLWRADALIENAKDAPVRFLSMEPLVAETSIADKLDPCAPPCGETAAVIDWVITGCESGAGARVTPIGWYRKLRDECAEFGTAFFLKQAVELGKLVQLGEGSWLKRQAGANVIEQPYLDGEQHTARPAVIP